MSNSSARDDKEGFVYYPFLPTRHLSRAMPRQHHEQGLDRSDFEVLVYDGGSTDKTIEILRTHASQPVWVSGLDGGKQMQSISVCVSHLVRLLLG